MNIIDAGLSFGPMSSNVPKAIVVHHIEAEGPTWTVQQIHNMHKNENGWSGIGYHYYIRLDGSVYKGRPDNCRGAHVAGFNTNSLGVAFEGDYDKRKEMPTAQYHTWYELKQYLFSKYGKMPIYGHKEVGSSECPGKYFPLQKVKEAENIEEEEDTIMNVKDVFCEEWYVKNYKDVRDAIAKGLFKNGYEHWVKYGRHEKTRKPNIGIPDDWNEAYYLLNNNDVNKNVSKGTGYQSGLHHYLLCGWKENRSWKAPQTTTKETQTRYRVVAGSYKDRANAEEQVRQVKAAGIDCFIDIAQV